MAWQLGVRKAKSFDSVTEKYPRASVWVILQDVTRTVACRARMIETKET